MQEKKANGRVEGEGSYNATRDYNVRTAKFMEKGNIEKAAREAEDAIDSPEGAELAKAEEKGKSKAKR